jgi:hypothetical protein
VIPLHGRFKNELGERCRLIPPVVRVTNFGLMATKWMQRMLNWYAETVVTRDSLFRESNDILRVVRKDNRMRARQTEFIFSISSRLVQVPEEQEPALFPDKRVNILTVVSITRRSFRHGTTTRSEILELSTMITDLNNRWRSVEKAQEKRIHHSSMRRSYYSGIRLKRFEQPMAVG